MIELSINNYQNLYDKTGRVTWKKARDYSIPEKISWCKTKTEAIYCLLNNIIKEPKCKDCFGNIRFKNMKHGYQKFCSKKCRANCDATYEIQKKTNMEKYGKEWPAQNDEVFEKLKNTNKDRYGTECTFSVKKFRKKSEDTWLKNYGATNPMKNPIFAKSVGKNIAKTKARLFGANLHRDCFLYCIENKELNILKIGITYGIENRLSQIKNDFGNGCELIFYQYFIGASNYESHYHLKYNDNCKIQESGNGRTEWFDIKIKDDLIKDLNNLSSYTTEEGVW